MRCETLGYQENRGAWCEEVVNQESVSLSLLMEVNNLEDEEELFTMATLAWTEE